MSQEPIIRDNANRFVIFPIVHKDLWALYEKQRKAFWWDTDVIMTSKDAEDWKSLTDNERHFLENILAFFASSDGIIMENLAQRFMSEIQIAEARFFFTIQMMIEAVHSIVYAKLLDGYVADPDRKRVLLEANTQIDCVKAKADWALRWISSPDASLAERLVAFVCVEGIFFSGAFCSIFWMMERGLLPAFTFSNRLISKDENLHVDNGICLYRNYISAKLTDARVHEIILGALEAERIFITDTLSCDLLGMNSVKMSQYIDHVANRLCIKLGHAPLFESTTQPFAFMDRICFDTKENFFETRVHNYQMPGEQVSVQNISFDEDV